jgi:predicted HicB family RNase H-like nuclease
MGQYLIDFPEDLHRDAKVRAAQDGVTLKELIIKAVEQYLKAAKGKKKGG